MSGLEVFLVAGLAALATALGGALALWLSPRSFFLSLVLGFASGIVLGTITLEVLPSAMNLGSVLFVAIGFAVGIAAVYAFDLFIHRGAMAGEDADQLRRVERYHQFRRPRGSRVTVLAGGTTGDEVVQGVSIGVGAAIDPNLAILIAGSIAVENLTEGLTIGELLREESHDDRSRYLGGVIRWTTAIAAAILTASLVSWLLFRDLPEVALAFLLALAGGGMLYLAATELIPEAQKRHYQESSALALAAGFLVMVVLVDLL